ncbi:MAG: hypothetical protein JRJ02_12610 [Deltaproteobacteria bacterium]|nr:hypothetical protein [Deltaproteobacteria bacterium]
MQRNAVDGLFTESSKRKDVKWLDIYLVDIFLKNLCWLLVPDMSIATSYYCDMRAKADELMQQRYGYPVVYLDSCMDEPWGKWPSYGPELGQYLGGKVNELFGTLKDLFGIEIDEGIWQEAKILAGKFFTAANQLNQL